MKVFLSILGIMCSLIALILSVWIIAPAQHTVLWLVAVVASEWSLHFAILALLGIGLGIASIISQRVVSGIVAIVFGMVALGCAAYPTLVSTAVAAAEGLSLSAGQYFFGMSVDEPAIETRYYSFVDDDSLAVDIYTSKSGDAITASPAVVVIHGGAWHGGTRSDFPDWNAWLVQQGFVVFDIDYRLAPQPNWQTAPADVQEAVRWIKSKAEVFGIDPENIVLLGRSAGGHLALQAAYTAAPSDSLPDATVQAVVSLYGPADLAWGYQNQANPKVINGPETLRRFTGTTPSDDPDIYELASPIHFANPEQPATLLIHGLKDQLVRSEHATRLLKILSESDTSTRHRALYIPYAQHGFDYNVNGWGSQIAQTIILNHLNSALSSGTTR